ncbi:branched-chain amino acid ABC transporter permease [Neoaquamicrobium sediminum]|uniref:branched-chain amino acid ABC transporter permease n=1 Tax=Neoaquamicrobium sediminum TaxID=1849104 RepID=UPI001566126C|nr:branched-chain amino acid ABC transporter permease [Mesorhizobium sediminum]NRC57258.1 branched-chain amino acid ABC transporter permease [Mesorhizobium sediminum]
MISQSLKLLFPGLGLIAILVFAAVVVLFIGSGELEGILTEALIYMIMVIALSIFVGNSGVISFGHVTFALVGAYASAWQTCCSSIRGVFMPGLPEFILHADVPVVLAVLTAALIAAVVAVLAGLIIMRLSSVAASIALLSLLFVFKTIYENWGSLTAGQSSVVGLPVYVNLWVALIWVALTITVAQTYMRSAHGLRLRAAREDEVAARAAGIVVWRERLIAFVISAFFFRYRWRFVRAFPGNTGCKHVLAQHDFPHVGNACRWGLRSLTGAVIGALAVASIRGVLRAFEQGVQIGGGRCRSHRGCRRLHLLSFFY